MISSDSFMRGPSSSHCAAALRIGRLTRDLMGGAIPAVLVQFDRAASLLATHASRNAVHFSLKLNCW
jgi:L-serine dehydratase